VTRSGILIPQAVVIRKTASKMGMIFLFMENSSDVDSEELYGGGSRKLRDEMPEKFST